MHHSLVKTSSVGTSSVRLWATHLFDNGMAELKLFLSPTLDATELEIFRRHV